MPSVMPSTRPAIPQTQRQPALPSARIPRTSRYEHGAMVNIYNGANTTLSMWVRKDFECNLVQVMVKKRDDVRPVDTCECYPVVTITADGNCYRNGGLPADWSIQLVEGRRIREIA